MAHNYFFEISGLFRGAILQSGTALTPETLMKRAKFFAYETGKLFSPNFSTTNTSQELLNLLITIPAKNITYADFSVSGYNIAQLCSNDKTYLIFVLKYSLEQVAAFFCITISSILF